MANETIPEKDFPQRTRQPHALWTLASTELWERFSFYGIQAILAYYIYYSATDGGLGLPEVEALAITGAYGGAVYLGQPVGAWLADRVIPVRTMVLVGSVIIVAGHGTLAIGTGLPGLLLGLTLIAIGTSALFPNILALMSLLYEDKPLVRDAGFILYYTGITFGSFLGPVVTGLLQAHIGFHVAFAAAAFGMCIGLLGFVLGRRGMRGVGTEVPNPLKARSAGKYVAMAGVVVLAAGLLIWLGVLTTTNINNVVLTITLTVSVSYFLVMCRSSKVDAEERRRVIAYVPLFVASVIVWTLVLQLFTTFAVYADTRVDLTIWGLDIPPAYISTFSVIASVIAGPLIAYFGQRRAVRHPERTVSSSTKIGLSLLVFTVTFLLFSLYPVLFDDLVPVAAVMVALAFQGITEVSFGSMYFSVTGELSPKAFNAQMMALAGLSLGIGASLSGFMGQLYVSIDEQVYFLISAGLTVISALLVFSVGKVWRRIGLDSD